MKPRSLVAFAFVGLAACHVHVQEPRTQVAVEVYDLGPPPGEAVWSVEIFYDAIRHGRYICFLSPDTRLDMMYMPDAVRAAVDVMEADPTRLVHRNAFNVTAMNFTPAELAAEIEKHVPGFSVEYQVDPVRQKIADSWPDSLDDGAAREEWGWAPEYDLPMLVRDMLDNLRRKLTHES